MPRRNRNPGSGKPPCNTPATGNFVDKPPSGMPAKGNGYGGQAQGYGSGLSRAAPITADRARQLAAMAMTDDAVARRAAREEITARLLGRQIEYALDGVPDGARALIADKVLDRFHGRAPQTVAGDPERPQIIRVITGVPRPEDDILAVEMD